MTESTDTPRIYVASLSDYNAGRLLGVWIDADQSADDISAEVMAMLATSTEDVAEEWAIHDYEGFRGIKLGEWESFERVAELGAAISEHGDAMAAYLANDSYNTPDGFEESYQGEWPDLGEYAAELMDDCYGVDNLPDWVSSYVDWDAMGRDFELGGDVWTADSPGGVYVFRNE